MSFVPLSRPLRAPAALLSAGDADTFWGELDTERMWEAGWQATAMLFQGEYDTEGEDE